MALGFFLQKDRETKDRQKNNTVKSYFISTSILFVLTFFGLKIANYYLIISLPSYTRSTIQTIIM